MAGKLATVGLNAEELILLTSMLAILAIRTQEQWELVNYANADVYIVNSDSPKGAIFIQQFGHSANVIRYSQKTVPSNVFDVQKPMRARDLLAALEAHSKNIASSSPLTWLRRFA